MITDPQAIRFVNEVIRPMAERLRALKSDVDSATTTWFGGVNALVPNQAGEAVDDKRELEGVSRLTGADVTNLVAQLLSFQAQLNGGGVAAVISKPCVRPLAAV